MSKKTFKQVFFLLSLFFLVAFQSEPSKLSTPEFPEVKFMVFSDPHYYDPQLGTRGEAFSDYLDNDRKLLKESEEILKEAFRKIKSSHSDFVIIPGDLTKDGTKLSHTRFAEYLAEIENMGKEVYVVPGNHDVSNPESYSYKGKEKILVENVDAGSFADIYSKYGYQQALYRDPSSLSYVAEPTDELWLFAMDACRYRENKAGSHPVTGGKFSDETLVWIENMLNLAHATHKSVIGFMHHGILEHYKKQSKFFGEYLVEDYKNVSQLFASRGMKLVFTGHYHAQDIVSNYYTDNSFIFDIETGSLVTWPCPLRSVSLKNNTAVIKSLFVESIPSHPDDFPDFAREFVWSGIEGIAKNTLIDFKLDESEAAMLSGQVADAFLAHYQGDETSPEKAFNLDGVSLKGRFLIGFKKKLVWNLWNDKDPQDNFVKINLTNGSIVESDPV